MVLSRTLSILVSSDTGPAARHNHQLAAPTEIPVWKTHIAVATSARRVVHTEKMDDDGGIY